MRTINEIIIHCTATPEGREVSVEQIDRDHRSRGWSGIGYHFVVSLSGTVHKGRPIEKPGAHAKGHNAHSIGIAYVGGLDKETLLPKDTRTPEQQIALRMFCLSLLLRFPNAKIIGHRDISPDRNGNGVVDPYERIKACPCFDVIPWAQKEVKKEIQRLSFDSGSTEI